MTLVPKDGRCRPFAGTPSDPSLRGISRTHAVRCCPSDYGFDPDLVRRSCGFTDYLGESEELACVHRFRGADDRVHEFRLTPILDLAFTAAIALHERGAFVGEHLGEAPGDLPTLWWSAAEGRRWAFVPNWPIVRRLAWDEAACDPARIQPVLARMLEAPADPAATVPVPRLIDEASDAGQDAVSPSLIDRELTELDPARTYPLPRQAPALVHNLLGAAAAGDLPGLASLVEPNARIGLPDRRELGARSLLANDSGLAAATLLAHGAARFPAEAELHCPVIDRRTRPRVARGEALMWCVWMSEDGLDLLVFGLRGRVIEGHNDGRVAYVGVFPVRPVGPVVVPGEPPPPGVVEAPALVSGDPHALELSGDD